MLLRRLGRYDYRAVFDAMRAFTARRDVATPDELWWVEHPPVFTQGQAGKAEHLLAPGEIPVVQVDRGGQVTYHGPGQLVVYCLLDVRRLGLGPRALVTALERSVIEWLADRGVAARARPDAPGVYVADAKVASLGLRIRQGRSYHGLSLNVAMDLEPFTRINPCGYPGLRVTQLREIGIELTLEAAAEELLPRLGHKLGYTCFGHCAGLP
ncbi:MAG: lipoyl(octanoyl) transferase LipB [Candidatus Competibacteraceae bacterium]|nr:lipoyl(octanoyl) transferase LipB [Candidatus Competibacteraceae bacterium]MBK7984237.1 lipoyl(octanoyl) transferase LipB [Candidatus Competibacteraceae bacterium]MBK8896204.1 lipoyl(octanoyl) transferase LipB [Candidatus Competibacteraceae bacterium]MBK8964986.1 lipoyl(octanoyl) transferase LipB [Candidatus Competibacteraceae bacterium]MBK9950267.1 lipoyl(octanoyl) transferase LipB [Candidatus Competibacteraceae bacterium]